MRNLRETSRAKTADGTVLVLREFAEKVAVKKIFGNKKDRGYRAETKFYQKVTFA